MLPLTKKKKVGFEVAHKPYCRYMLIPIWVVISRL
jgi:hypothetical protein